MTIPGKLVTDKALRAAVHLSSSKVPSELLKSSAALFSAYGGAKPALPDLKYDYGALARTLFCRRVSFAWLLICLYLSLSIICSHHQCMNGMSLHVVTAAISAETMTIHHTKHHNAYVTNLNVALEKLDAAVSVGDVSGIIALQGALKFNGGGHLNHTLFWENLSPDSAGPQGALATCINSCFGDFAAMKTELSAKSVAVQGSGWGWLGFNKATGRMEIATCANQDPLHATTGLIPLMGIDVWEHAYYVDYRNVRPDYVKAIWDVINWKVVAERLAAAKK
jgi:superoxide dismutase, Fe-Mn family